jgi:hypothetical protein
MKIYIFSQFTGSMMVGIKDTISVTLKFSQKDGANIKVKNFKIIPEICRQQGRSITVNKTMETIHISRCNTVEKDSPCGNVSKPTDNYSCDDIEVDKSEDLSLLAY